MSKKKEILIHTALFSEAKPIISHFKLRQYETKPFKIFRGAAPGGGNILLVVSGIGKENTLEALNFVNGNGRKNRYSLALNIGMAGCNDMSIPPGSVFSSFGNLPGVDKMPLISSDSPVTSLEKTGSFLVDMEAKYFLEYMKTHIPDAELFVLKVVSDHLDDSIKKAADINRLIEDSIPLWEVLIDDYPQKLNSLILQTPFNNLSSEERELIRRQSLKYRFSHQEVKQIIEMALDFQMWDEEGAGSILNKEHTTRKDAFNAVKDGWNQLKNTAKSYIGFKGSTDLPRIGGKSLVNINRETPGFGRCPVASERTRCCNLLTLDAVEGCGFDCSYCSIRYFYSGDSIGIDEGFIHKLKNLEIDPDKTYHIGTGQSSDSLMWGNKAGILDALLDFAEEHPNVILELKTKSDNISHLLSRKIPGNVLTTWSVNPQIIIDNEEHFTASLRARLVAARQIASRGNLVGFHFHPMVYYDNWQTDYGSLISEIISDFQPEDVALVSLGTLTFIKPVIKKMRERKVKSRILQMPLEDAEGKFSYPLEIKKEMFSFAYRAFAPWHEKVYFYMCMENVGLWKDVFGYEYSSNEDFEKGMLKSYRGKILEKCNTDR